MKKALITGITGQDGSYLTELLLSKGYSVYGLVRRTSSDPLIRLGSHTKEIEVLYGNLRDIGALERAIETAKPDEVYNLAAQSDVGISFKCPEETFEINYYGVGRLINAIERIKPDTKFYQASTSEMFGRTNPPQNEQSPLQPVSPYGEAKVKAYEDFVKQYREKHDLFASSGILFNHESPRRGEHFVTRKVTISLAKIKLGLQDSVSLGNLNAKRDWGFAGDYVEAMWKMLQLDKADDFVIGTGIMHTVREFVQHAGAAIDLPISFEGEGLDEVGRDSKGKVVVKVDSKFYRPHEVDALQADISKSKRVLGWEPKTSFEALASLMAKSDLERLSRV
jgi:GDPmannose 4,6-dehydratase